MRPDQISTLIYDLDVVFQSTLDRLESWARDALIIDKAIRQILDQPDEDDSVLNWNPERAMSPRHAFRALAQRVVQAADETLTRTDNAITTLDYEDLLNWPDEPKRQPGQPLAHELFRRIEYARRKTLRAFWNRLSVRIAPDRDPEAARISATSDLVSAFGVETPERMLVPYRSRESFRTLLLPFNRTIGDIEWTVHAPALVNMTGANHALATLCRLDGDATVAASIHELNGSLHSRMKTSFRQYKPRETYFAGDHLQIVLCRDHVDYRLGERVWSRVWDALPSSSMDLQFVDSPEKL
jgi:hypothetical protein